MDAKNSQTHAAGPEFGDRLGYPFTDPELLERALTHASMPLADGEGGDNQRLEFLGDAVLGLLVAEAVYRRYPDADEAFMSSLRAHCVSGPALAQAAEALGIERSLRVSEAERGNNPERTRSMLEDALEALVGAVYLDGGLEAARQLVTRLLGARIEQPPETVRSGNAKNRLQEWSQRQHQGALPEYELIECSGPDHAKHYRVAVKVAGHPLGEGSGRSKKAAELLAAGAALRQLGDD